MPDEVAWIDAAGALRLPALHLQNVLLQGVSLRTAINAIQPGKPGGG
ncbi:hypothetical protein BN135_333 [Cronobacter muytjensii 530]